MDTRALYNLIYFLVGGILLLLGFTVYYTYTYDNAENPVILGCGTIGLDEAAGIDSSMIEGRTLFRNNCASCHNKNMKTDLTGPALGGIKERWSAFPPEDLYRWIRDSQSMVLEEHPRALELWEAWKPTVMTPFRNLTDEEIAALIAYVEFVDRRD